MRCQLHCGQDRLSGVNYTVDKTDSAVSMTLWTRQTQWCQWHCERVRLSGVNDTVDKSDSAVSMTLWTSQTQRCQWHCGQVRLSGVNDTLDESGSAVSMTPRSPKQQHQRELFKPKKCQERSSKPRASKYNCLAHGSWVQMSFSHGKESVNILWNCTFYFKNYKQKLFWLSGVKDNMHIQIPSRIWNHQRKTSANKRPIDGLSWKNRGKNLVTLPLESLPTSQDK